MYVKNRSGQFLPFCLVSALSGNPVPLASGGISGRRTIDGGLQIVLSGPITENSGGQYIANLYDFDTNGNIIGYYFTASGCVPVHYTIVTQNNVSGQLSPASGLVYPASGASVVGTVLSGTLFPSSGATFIASGPFVNATATVASGALYLASGSIFLNTFASGVLGTSGSLATAWGSSGAVTVGQNLVSGQTVLIASGQLSGFTVTPMSGVVQIASGPFVVATASVASGSLYLASGSIFNYTFASGVIGGGSGNLPSAWGNSGSVVTAINQDKSGYVGTVISGTTQIASGPFTVSVPLSGQTFLASGSLVNLLSGNTVQLYSGQTVLVASGQLSGYTVTPMSGVTQIASGPFTVSLPLSGQTFIASGSSVNLLSGNTTQLYSGQSVLIASGQLSGYAVLPTSGQTFIASGPNVVATASVASGSLYLASGSILRTTFATDVLGLSGGIATAWGGSGAVTLGQNLTSGVMYLASGSAVNLLSGNTVQLYSGQSALPASGQTYLASGSLLKNIFASGVITVEFPYAQLKVDQSGITGEALHSPLNALRKLDNHWDLTATSGYLTVYKEDGTTVAYTQPVGVTSGALPITSLN